MIIPYFLGSVLGSRQGFTLIELMVSLFLFSIGLLVFENMQLISIKMNQEALDMTLGVQQLLNMQERMKLGDTDNEVIQWNAENRTLLPNAAGEVDSDSIQLTWKRKENEKTLRIHFN